MSDISQVEERLFLLLDAVEKLTEETKEIQAAVITQQALADQQQETLFSAVDTKLNSFEIDQEHFDKVVQNTVYYAVVKNIGDGVYKEVNKAVDRATAQSMHKLVTTIGEATTKVKDNKKLVSTVQLDSLERSERIRDELKKYEKSLATKHYKLVTMFGGGMFLVMCFILFIFYHLVVPSENELRNLKYQREMLQKDVIQLQQRKGIHYR